MGTVIVHSWNSSPLRSDPLRLQCTCCTVPTTSGTPHGSPLMWACQWLLSQPLSSPQLFHNDSLWANGITKSHGEQGMDYRDGDELSWCSSWSNSLWQGWSCGLVHCPGRNATDPIWRLLASSLGISFWTPLKPQHINPNPLANQLWCIDFLTPPTPLIIPLGLPAFLESLMPLKNWCSIHARCIFKIHQLLQSGFRRVYFNSCCSCSFEPEIIRIGQSSHKIYSNNIPNFQVSTTILNACIKKVWKLIDCITY